MHANNIAMTRRDGDRTRNREGARTGVARSLANRDGDYVLEDQIGYLLRRAHQRATAIFMERMAAQLLTPTQYAALVKIHDLGSVSQNELGRLTAMDPATMQGVIQRLRDRDLVSRRPDPADRRRTLLSLTKAGAAIVDGAIGVGRDVTADTLAPLSDSEQKAFLSLLRRLC